jgi:P4 family phage/plasmid primase-like protien
MTDTLTGALMWHDAACSVLRVVADGSKRPDGPWKQYQSERADRTTIEAWFANGHPGVGVVTGEVSGELELLELEGRAIAEGLLLQLAEACERLQIGDVWRTITTSCAEASPSGGLHVFYRVPEGVDKNTKLAQRLARDEELTDDEQDLIAQGKRVPRGLIETRGEGGFVVVAPSTGAVHPTGKPYQFLAGNPSSIPIITGEQRDLLHIAARSLDQMPAPAVIPDVTVLDRTRTEGGISPGDDYNNRGSWVNLLQDHGWTVVWGDSTRTYWRRPGKASGISAVTGGTEGDYFYSWTTSTVLPAEEAMSKWRVYAVLEHGGDFSAAAKALKDDGFGQNPPPPTRPVLSVLPQFTSAGSSAHAVDHDEHPEPMPTHMPGQVSTLERSDDGNALALVDAYGSQIRHCPERGRWLHWTGDRWEWCPSTGGVIREYAKRIARSLGDDDKTAIAHKQRSLSAIGTSAMLAQAATDPRVVVALDDLDARPYELNTPGGIVDLRTGQLAPHDSAHLHTRIANCTPDPDADPTRWTKFLATTFNDDVLIGYLQRLLGYSATGVVRDHVLPFCHGQGGNGKGVFLETAQKVLGDYATTAPAGFLMAKQNPAHETEIARLAGSRMVLCSEVGDEDRFDEARIKQLTGGDTLTARFMRQDHFTFEPTHKLWLMGNHQPQVRAGGHSFWRRVRLVPFQHKVPDEDRIDDLQGIFGRDHGGAVLAWIVAGAVAYLSGGLEEPEAVRVATADYAHDQDTLARFIEENCHLADSRQVRVPMPKMRDAYEAWCHAEGETAVNPKRFGMDLRARYGVGEAKSNGRKFYVGVALLAQESEEESK